MWLEWLKIAHYTDPGWLISASNMCKVWYGSSNWINLEDKTNCMAATQSLAQTTRLSQYCTSSFVDTSSSLIKAMSTKINLHRLTSSDRILRKLQMIRIEFQVSTPVQCICTWTVWYSSVTYTIYYLINLYCTYTYMGVLTSWIKSWSFVTYAKSCR